ncbi:MAG: HAMP domain-containing sensor histidine kinase [Bacteroidota bacterium]
MSRLSLRTVILLMSLALIGLVGFQLYWIDGVIRAQEQGFKKDVIEALQTVSEKLEMQETYAYMQKTMMAQQGTPGSSQTTGGSVFFEISDSLFLSQQLSVSLNIMSRGSVSPQAPSTLPEQRMVATDTQLPSEMQKVSNRSNMVVTVLQEMLMSTRSLQTRLSPEFLDSLLAYELKERAIDIDYHYGVLVPHQDRFVYLADDLEKDALLNSELRASLFPNDLTGDFQYLVIDFPEKSRFLLGKIWLTSASSGVLVLVVMFCFGYAIRTILRQKKLSEMKTDFINNMTHELKTPIATVGLAVEALQDKDVRSAPTMGDRYLGMIQEENTRLGHHVEKVLQMAAIEKNDLRMKKEPIDLHELIHDAVAKFSLQVEKREGEIRTILNARDTMVAADPSHLMNVVLNLLDNANKYSPDAPSITLRSEQRGKYIVLSVQDHGLGMSREAARQIFQKFYRVPTGNRHDVKGFGLGLAYVKSVIDQHDGEISVDSELGRGSKFFVTLPLI